jgi:hypothetical protein
MIPAPCGLTGGRGHECMLLSDAASAGTMSMGVVFHWRMTRVVGVVLIPTLTVCIKLAMRLYCGGNKIYTVRGSSLVFLLSALAFLSSCHLIQLSLLCLGTVLTLLHWRSVAIQ